MVYLRFESEAFQDARLLFKPIEKFGDIDIDIDIVSLPGEELHLDITTRLCPLSVRNADKSDRAR